MWTYRIHLYKEDGRLKSETRQWSGNHEVWNFFKLVEPTLKRAMKHPRPPDHRPPLTQLLSHSLTLLLQLFFASLINWSWNQAKSTSYCLLEAHSSEQWKMAAFPETSTTSGWAMITPGCSADQNISYKACRVVEKCGLFSFSADRQVR